MGIPTPSNPAPDDADRRAEAAQRRARQRRQKLLQLLILIGVAVVVILAGSDARPSGTNQALSPAESRWFTATALLGVVPIALAVLMGIVAAQWPWRRRFVLRRGGLLGALWLATVLIWLPSPVGNPVVLLLEVATVLLGAGLGGFLWFRQRRANRHDPTPEALAQAVAKQQAIAARNLEINPTAAAGAYYNAAMAEQRRGNLPEARHALQEALAICEEQDDVLMQVHCLNALGQITPESPRRALAYYEQALARFQQEIKGRFRWQAFLGLASYESNEIMLLNNTGSAHLSLGQPSEALPLLEAALTLYRRVQEPRAMFPVLLLNLGKTHARLGHVDEARALIAEARAALDATADLPPIQREYLERELDEALEPPSAPSPPDSILPPESPAG